MKKQFLNLGKALSKAEQKEIFGGTHLQDEWPRCEDGTVCPETCVNGTCDGVVII